MYNNNFNNKLMPNYKIHMFYMNFNENLLNFSHLNKINRF